MYIYIYIVRPSRRDCPVVAVVVFLSPSPGRPSRRRRPSSVRLSRRVRPVVDVCPSVVPSSVPSASSVLCPSGPSSVVRPSSARRPSTTGTTNAENTKMQNDKNIFHITLRHLKALGCVWGGGHRK